MSDSNVVREEYNRDMKRLDIKNQNQDEQILDVTSRVTSLETFWRILGKLPDDVTIVKEEQIKMSSAFEQVSNTLIALQKGMEEMRLANDKRLVDIKKEIKEDTQRQIDELKSEIISNREEIETQKGEIETQKKRGTVDYLGAVKTNLWAIILGLLGGFAVLKDFFM